MTSRNPKRSETLRLIVTGFLGIGIGVFIGLSYTSGSSFLLSSMPARLQDCRTPEPVVCKTLNSSSSNPPGTETLPPGIVVAKTDLFLRRLWGKPEEDLPFTPRYLLALTVGVNQMEMVDKAVSRFDKEWFIILFHYDGHTDAWDKYEWSQRAVHVGVKRQTKWWYAKRFLHPDVVEPFEYLFIWDEDLDLEHFDPQKYLALVRKYELEISQPGLEPEHTTWQMTKRRGDTEVHKTAEERPGWCREGPQKPPCAAFVEIMAPVFSRAAWRCVWHMIQNDLVHGWGLDFGLQKCAKPAHERIGVVDAQWIRHKGVPSLGNQGEASDGRQPWEGVRERCNKEWLTFAARMRQAEELQNSTRVAGSQ